MSKTDRRQIVRDYKEKPVAAGVFAIRCAPAQGVWVGVSRNIEAQANGMRFQLRMGSHPNRAVQAALRAHGAEAFTYEELERIEDPDLTPVGLADELKRRERHWIEALDAQPLA
jgi:hypothetical protein